MALIVALTVFVVLEICGVLHATSKVKEQLEMNLIESNDSVVEYRFRTETHDISIKSASDTVIVERNKVDNH